MKVQMNPHLFQCLLQIVLVEDLVLVIWQMLLQKWLAKLLVHFHQMVVVRHVPR